VTALVDPLDDVKFSADLADLDGNARLPIRQGPWVVVAAKRHDCARCDAPIVPHEPTVTRLWASKRSQVRRYLCLPCGARVWPDARPLADRRAMLAASRAFRNASRVEDLSPALVALVGSLLARAVGCPF